VDGNGLEVWSGRANPWECDQMGHLNVRFHIAKAMEALAAFAAEAGMPRAFAPSAESTLNVRELHIRFLREAKPGAGLSVSVAVTALGEADARVLLVMRHDSGEPASTFHAQVEHVTAREGRAFAWPARVLARLQELGGEVPAFAAPRGLTLAPVTTIASLDRARELGIARTSTGVITPADCDAFGRMRPEVFIGRISDGLTRMPGRALPGARPEAQGQGVGGAALEYRLLHHAWPRAGDRVTVFGGLAEAQERTRRVVFWMVDPDSGRPWGSAEGVAASFDLAARKLVVLSPEALAAVRADETPGLAL